MDFDIAENGQRGLIVDGVWFCEELIVPAIRNLEDSKRRLSSALAPIRRHAQSHEYAPPLRLSVQDCKEIVRMVDRC